VILIGGTDLETTGFLEPEHRIIEACLSTYLYDPVKRIGTLRDTNTWRIDPKRPIDAKARAVHGITETDLIGKPTFDIVAPDFSARLNECDVVVAHNGLTFDFPFIIQELERVRVELPDFIPFDTMVHGRWSTPLGKAPNLEELCFSSGVTYDHIKAHAADYDVDCMMQCFFFGLRRGVYTVPGMIA
jgi:DNA polymerase-3 subunit epsilon